MGMNFPSPAVPGQIYAPAGGPVYRFDDPVWTAVTAADSADVYAAVRQVATRADLKALDMAIWPVAYLMENGREGIFEWTSGDFTTQLAADPTGIAYLKADGTAITIGAWVRQFDGPLEASWAGAIPDGAVSTDAMYTACLDLFLAAVALRKDMHFPAGTYAVRTFPGSPTVDVNFPFMKPGSDYTSLYDCNDISLIADGPATVFKTQSIDGADVFNLRALKNFNIVGFPTLTGSLDVTTGAGSNGCSIVYGWDNLFIQVRGYNLPSVDKGANTDGGCAFSIQPGLSLIAGGCGRAVAEVFADGCAKGASFDSKTDDMLAQRVAVDITLHAENCYRAFVVSAPAATGAIPDSYADGVTIRGEAVNCQQGLVMARAYGVNATIMVKSTKTAAQKRLNPAGAPWITSDTLVYGLMMAGVRRSNVSVSGDVGACDYKAQIGGAPAGGSGLSARSMYNRIDLNVGGVAAIADLLDIPSGGNHIANSWFALTPASYSSVKANIPTIWIDPTQQNNFDLYDESRHINPKLFTPVVNGDMAIVNNAGVALGKIGLSGSVMALHGQVSATAGVVVAGLADNAGTFRFGIRNGNGLVVDAATTSAAIGAYVSKMAVYNTAGTLIGYFPIYA